MRKLVSWKKEEKGRPKEAQVRRDRERQYPGKLSGGEGRIVRELGDGEAGREAGPVISNAPEALVFFES